MLRVTIQESPKAVTLILEGRLTGPWIGEVERAWSAAADTTSDRKLVVDLAGVTFVEEEGKKLLRRIFERGGDLRADDVMIKAIVEEVQGKASQTPMTNDQ
jgi:anti-anti-sigma regulatory factor